MAGIWQGSRATAPTAIARPTIDNVVADPTPRSSASIAVALSAVLVAAAISACGGDAPVPTPFVAGTSADPREVIVVTRDYLFQPSIVELVPGETVTFQVVNGGLIVHEAVFGPMAVQDAWEAAEAAAAGGPPGETPAVSVPPALAGLRIVVRSGQRVDVTWTVPTEAAAGPAAWLVGCHIPGHWAEGMVGAVRFVDPSGSPLPTAGSR